MLLVGKVLLTFAVLGIGVVPVRADLNHTHATNPLWTAHARYHVVWQVLSYVGLTIVALAVLWAPASHARARVDLVAAIVLCVYGGFFGAAATMRRYDGRRYDDNGYPPVPLPFAAGRRADLNTIVFVVLVLILAVGWILALAA